MSSTVANIVAPLFGIMVIGFLSGHFRILDKAGSGLLSQFVFTIALPALVFVKLRDVPISEFFHWQFIGALGGGMLITLIVALAVGRFVFSNTLTATGLHGLTAMFSSTAYIGLPLLLIVFGDDALAPGVLGAVITVILFLPIAIVLAEIDRSANTGSFAFTQFIAILRTPVLIATAAGLTSSALGLTVPASVVTLCDLLGSAFIPCALFSAGLFMAGNTARIATAEIGWLIAAKLVLHPLITWWLAYHVFALEGMLPAIAVLQAALPSGVPVFVLAQQYQTFETQSNAVIVVSTALSIATLSGLILLLGM